jgi:hypothetical protein
VRGYDAWLTTDRSMEAQEAWADWVVDEWEQFAETQGLPLEACEEGHEIHGIYDGWEKLTLAIVEYRGRLEEEAAVREWEGWEEEHMGE